MTAVTTPGVAVANPYWPSWTGRDTNHIAAAWGR
jgi:hypothetical protein